MIYILLVLVVLGAYFTIGHHSHEIKLRIQLNNEANEALSYLPVTTHTRGHLDKTETDGNGWLHITLTQSFTVIGLFYLFGRRVPLKYPIKLPLHFSSLNKNYYLFCFQQKSLDMEVYTGADFTNAQWAGTWQHQTYKQQKSYRITSQGKTVTQTLQAAVPIEKPLRWTLNRLQVAALKKGSAYSYQLEATLQLKPESIQMVFS
jgi:hypothetical protein